MSQLNQPGPNRNGPLNLFYEQFEAHLSMENYFQFFANRRRAGNETFLCSDIYSADKLATVICEEYSIRGKLAGFVIVGFPQTDTDVPIFTFQLGGNAKKSIALLDISATLPDIDYEPLRPVFEKYRELLHMEPSKLDWVNSICSPYLLHAQYEALDTDLFLAAMREYLAVWIEHYYLPGKTLTDAQTIDAVTNAIIKYKRVLHDNDPAYGIFHREWGEPMADAFFHIETRDHPSIPMPDHAGNKLKAWENKDLNILWERRAQERVMQAPEPVQQRIIESIETQAAADSMGIITLELFDKYKETLLASVAGG
jgi:hypothetical protein